MESNSDKYSTVEQTDKEHILNERRYWEKKIKKEDTGKKIKREHCRYKRK